MYTQFLNIDLLCYMELNVDYEANTRAKNMNRRDENVKVDVWTYEDGQDKKQEHQKENLGYVY